MNSSNRVFAIAEYSVLKNGVIRFLCPSCQEELSAALNDASKKGTCGKCGIQFVSPGQKEKSALLAAQAAKRELLRRQQEAEEKRVEEDLRRANQSAESFVDIGDRLRM